MESIALRHAEKVLSAIAVINSGPLPQLHPEDRGTFRMTIGTATKTPWWSWAWPLLALVMLGLQLLLHGNVFPSLVWHRFYSHRTAKQTSKSGCDLIRGDTMRPFQLDHPSAIRPPQ